MNAVAQQNDNSIHFPPGRIVQGDLYEPQTEDQQGNKLKVKSGPNQGQDRVDYFFAYAIPKAGEPAWWHTAWGGKIYGLARAAWPTLFDAQGNCLHPNFSWKVLDGDDTRPNPDAQMRRNCDREGWAGHWIVRLSSGYATRIFTEAGEPLLQPGLVKRGFWVEAIASVKSNGNTSKPGMYINHQYVAYRAPGKEIISGPDPRTLGFGKAPLPPGVTAAPIGATANLPAAAGVPGVPGVPPAMPAAPGFPPPPAAVPGVPGAVPGAFPPVAFAPPAAPPAAAPMPPPAVAVAPHPGFLAPPVPGAAPALPTAPAAPQFAPPPPPPPPAAPAADPLGAPAGFRMANLNGPNYATFRAQGWTDDLLTANGHMVRL